MEVKKEKSRLKASEFEVNISDEDYIPDLRTLESNIIIDQLEANMELRKTPIEKRVKKNLDVLR